MATQQIEQIDPVTLSVINNAFVNVCREMGTAMMRTSYSPIFNEGLDFSCMMFNTRGDLIGQAEFCPTMLGSCQYAMKWMLDEVGLDAFEPGDVFIHNDPYRGQCHMPEHLVVKAVFWKGRPWGFVANIAHVGEIGGMAPGSFAADATEVYQEGLRLPPIKIMERGEYVKDLWKVILANHRTPKTSWGDYHAMIGSLHVAEQRVLELLEKYGGEFLAAAADQLLDYSEAFMRAEIAEMPDGVYEAQDCMEDDGVTDKPYWMRLRLTIKGDEAICDWLDSDDQARGPINATFVVTAASCYSGFLHVVSDDIPINSGCYRPIRLVTRPGSLVNVKHPGPSVGGNTETHPHIQNVVLRALAGAVPDRVPAMEGATACNFLFGGVPPGVRRLLHQLPHRGERMGRHRRPRRQRRPLPEQRQLPQHPGRGPGDEVPVHRRALRAAQRLGRAGPISRRPGQLAHLPCHGAGDHRERPVRPDEDAGARHLRRWHRRQRRHLHQAAGRHRVPPILGGLRHRVRFEVHAGDRDRRRRDHAQLGWRRRLRQPARARPRTHRGRPAPGVRLAGGGGARLRIPGS